jgi:RNA recognition motif-containing protein
MLKVSNLLISTTESDLRELFSDYGEIRITGLLLLLPSGYVLVGLNNDENEKDAIGKLNGTLWRGNKIYVEKFQGEPGETQGDERNPLDPGAKQNS